MSRFRRVVQSVASGYLVLAANALCYLISVRVALHFLSAERLGLWTLMSSVTLYLGLIDFGMSSSVARLLIDHKDDRGGGEYGSLIKTGVLVLVVQGIFALVMGCVLAPLVSQVEHKNPDLRPDFIALMRWQSLTVALSFATRIFSHLLSAHQRFDIVNYGQLGGWVMNLSLMWGFFIAGQGVFSLVWANLLSVLGTAAFCAAACWRLQVFPLAGAWGRASWERFREMFDYGKDVFLVAVGTLFILSSQPLIINACLGSVAQALWGLGTRAFVQIMQVTWRIFDYSSPAFSEMIVRGERALLRERYHAVLVVSASLGAVSAVCFALCNSAFITVWTHAEFAWSPANDLLLAVWMVVLSISHCHDMFVLLTKKVGGMRYVFFVEGLVFAGAACLVVGGSGLAGVVLCSIVCSTCFSGAYGLWRVARYFGLPVYEVAVGWMAPTAGVLIRFVPVAVVIWWVSNRLNWVPAGEGIPATAAAAALHASQQTAHALFHLLFKAVAGGALGGYLLLRYGLPAGFKRELLERSPRRFNPFLRRVFA